ncbi:hypothetical protein [Tumebacillus flagellatus]|uniref:hypothetical protein n=1 Tax=Tumebacillus flagellatus TaxID=1157490 RepID=UPI001378012D|nr:hypothetical protein [Tumebacillus flagellatus]
MITLHVYHKYGIREIAIAPKWLDHSCRLKGYTVDGAMKAVELDDIVGIGGE